MSHDSRVGLCRAGVVVVLLAAFGSGRAEAGWVETRDDGTTVIHVKVFRLPSPAARDGHNRAEVAGVRAFKRQFSQIFAERYRDRYKADPQIYGEHNWDRMEVELHAFSGIQVEGVENDLIAIAGGMAPDVLELTFSKSDNYIRSGFLYPLDNPDDGYLTAMSQEEIDFRVHPKLWPVIRRKGPDGVNRVWALPYGGAIGKVLMFRKTLFDELGIPYPNADWTWEDLYHAATKITDLKRGIYGLRFGKGKRESWFWVTFLWSAGGEVMTLDPKTGTWRCVFDTREAAVALDFYTRLTTEKWVDDQGNIHRGYALKDWTSRGPGATKSDRGEIGMEFAQMLESTFIWNRNPEVTGIAPVPLGPTGHRGAELNSRMMGLFSQIEHPAVRDAAWEYIRFYDSIKARKIKTRVLVENGLGEFVNPKYLRMFDYAWVERMAPKGWAKTFEIAVATGKPEPYGRGSSYAYDLMSIPIQQAEQLAFADKLPEDEEQRLDVLQDLLRNAAARANREILGIVSPMDRRLRDLTASVVLIGIVISFVFVFRKVVQAFVPPTVEGAGPQVRWGFRKYVWAYVLLIPAALTIVVWQYVPLVRGSVMAFQDYRLIGDSSWVWVQNFGDTMWDGFWWQSVWNAIRYSFLIMALTFLPPIILAILLQEVPRGKMLFRTIYYLPAVITGLVTILLWKQFYEPSKAGVLNALVLKVPAIGFLAVGAVLLLVALLFARRLWYHEARLSASLLALGGFVLLFTCGALAKPILFRHGEMLWSSLAQLLPRLLATTPEAYRWLGDPKTAMVACVLPMVWAGVGPGCLIYLAALKGVPEELYEAADVDGAPFIDKVLFVIFPILKPLILINFIGAFIGSWYGASGNILAMTGGAANTEVAGLHIFYKAFIFLKFGPATAMAWMLAFLLIGFTVHQLRILSRLEFRTTGD